MSAETKGDARDDRLKGPVHNYLRRDEEKIRKLLGKEALDKCHEPRAAYVACAHGRTVTAPFYCRTLFNELNTCLGKHTGPEQFEERKVQFYREKAEREAAAAAAAARKN